MVRINRTWETVEFEAYMKGSNDTCMIELTMNHETGKYVLSSPNQDENVRLKGGSIEQLELNLEAIKAAVKYVKENLTPKQ